MSSNNKNKLSVNARTNPRFGHRKTQSSSGIGASYDDVSDMQSIYSNNSFSSVGNLMSNNNNSFWSLNRSNESLHSLPDQFQFNSDKKLTSNIPKFKTKNAKKNFLLNLKNKNKQSLKYNSSTPPALDSHIIVEDDESEQALNVPMLPAFGISGKPKNNINKNNIPPPRSAAQHDYFGNYPNTLNVFSDNNKIKDNNNTPDFDFNDDDQISNEKDKIIKSMIDQDFNLNFSKDSQLPKGSKLQEIRKKRGLVEKRPISRLSSSDDDASTEGEEDYDNQPHEYVSNNNDDLNDNTSIKSDTSSKSKKAIFKSFLRKRGFSIGSESMKSGSGEKNSLEKIESPTIGNPLKLTKTLSRSSSRKRRNNSISIHEQLDDYSNEKIEDSTSLSEKNEGTEAINSIGPNDISDVGSNNSKSEHFLKNIFHLDGLLGQGGLVPNLNLAHNQDTTIRRGDQVHDVENPLPDFHDEVEREAKTLVGHMFSSPLEDFRKRTKNRTNKIKNSFNGNGGKNARDTSNNISRTSTGSSTGLYVPERAHLPVDPFDDLQNFDKFSIDVPDNIIDKPRKYKTGIQSALLQLYNTHLMPANISSTNSLEGSTLYNDSDVNYDSDATDLQTDYNLNMNLDAEIRRGGLQILHPSSAATLNSEFPEFEEKMKGISEDAEAKFDKIDKFSKFHKRAASFQDFIAKPDMKKLNISNMSSNSNPKRKTGVSFELPDFRTQTTTADTPLEKKELLGYKNLRKRAKFNRRVKKESAARITVHITDVLERQRFILTLCKAFMLYGAPTHRLEEYMSMTSQVLEIDGSFIYFPGCMLVSFGDLNARTSEMKLVRCAQGLDLGKLDEVHDIYKNVVHDRLGTIEGYKLLDEIMNRKSKFNAWWCILFYSLASLAVAPWSFGGSWVDLPICFGIGAVIAFLQFVICPKNTLYSSVFEICSSIIASFIARAIGSINGGNTFCYAALVQSPLALILPGYIILCGSLELQSRNIVAGSVRMFYAFIYSLMLSFGITLGAALYGWIDKNATSATSCSSNISPWYRFLFIPMFTIGIALTNQASWSQLPMMCIISGCGYVVTYFSSLHFKNVTELNATLGCFIIGLVANIYSRALKSFNKYFTTRGTFMTVSLMLPAIFVQVPSGIASQGSVFTGISTANNITHSNSAQDVSGDSGTLSFGIVMIQVALGISVGLYLSTILVYPFGKKKTGLFTL